MTPLTDRTRRLVDRLFAANDRYQASAYCQTPQNLLPVQFEIDHIVPSSSDQREDLCLSCPTCNRFKGSKVEAVDEVTGQVVRLFHPRQQRWDEHFVWSRDGLRIIGRTAIGRATATTLRLNHDWWMPCRADWVLRGDFPPSMALSDTATDLRSEVSPRE